MGDIDAHYDLGLLYRMGLGVEKDKKKVVYHSEEAAICSHPAARWKLGFIEEKNGNSERSVKHGNDKDGCIQERICQQR